MRLVLVLLTLLLPFLIHAFAPQPEHGRGEAKLERRALPVGRSAALFRPITMSVPMVTSGSPVRLGEVVERMCRMRHTY